MHLKQQLLKNLKITIAILSKNAVEKNEEKKIMTIAKLFALHTNAKSDVNSQKLKYQYS